MRSGRVTPPDHSDLVESLSYHMGRKLDVDEVHVDHDRRGELMVGTPWGSWLYFEDGVLTETFKRLDGGREFIRYRAGKVVSRVSFGRSVRRPKHPELN
jgi:hypothetical protein